MRFALRSKLRARVGVAALLAALVGSAILAPQASADPGTGQAHVTWNVTNASGAPEASRYARMIEDVRRAAGHAYRNNVYETDRSDRGLVVMRVNFSELSAGGGFQGELDLYFTADNMYLRGYSAPSSGTVFQLNDYNLAARLGVANFETLPWSSSYIDLQGPGAANIHRSALLYSAETILRTFITLSNSTNQPSNTRPADRQLAIAILRIAALIPEAARFNAIRDDFVNIYSSTVNLPLRNHDYLLETNWRSISAYAHAISQDPTTAPRRIAGIDFTSFTTVSRELGLILSSA